MAKRRVPKALRGFTFKRGGRKAKIAGRKGGNKRARKA